MPTLTLVPVRYQTIRIDGLDVFYREAGDVSQPTILLLHGFPSSSHMYRDLITDLAGSYHLVAPDYPGFGHSSAPDPTQFAYTFDRLSEVIEGFIDTLGLTSFSLFVQDYGAPVGYRIAARRPELIQALLIQNANAYLEGIGPAMAAIPAFWAERNAATEAPLRDLMTLKGTKFQYLTGAQHPERISPDAYHYDQYFLDRPDNGEIQLDLLYDYQHNILRYEEWHQYLRDHQPPALITWGENDPFFIAAGAMAYQQDLPHAEIHLLPTGHFALEEYHHEVAGYIRQFLTRRGIH